MTGTTARIASTQEATELTAAFADLAAWFSTTTAYPASIVAIPTPFAWHYATVQEARYAYMPQPAVALADDIEAVPQLGMTFQEAVRRGRLLSHRLGDAADVDVGD